MLRRQRFLRRRGDFSDGNLHAIENQSEHVMLSESEASGGSHTDLPVAQMLRSHSA